METPDKSPPHTPTRHTVLRERGTLDPKWEVWLRIFLSFLLGGFSAAFFLGGKSRNVDELLIWKGESIRQFAELVARIDRMDTNGTARSHWVDENQSAQIATNAAAISELRSKQEQRGETISVMQGKIERIDSELKRIEDKGRP